MSLQVSLIIPVYNEGRTIEDLINTINEQTFSPAEIILVDGGSTDDTVIKLKQLVGQDGRYNIIEAGRAMPGKGRNIGTKQARFEWIAYTDAGIKLDKQWLYHLVEAKQKNENASVIYGNYAPQINSLFDKCASVAYVEPMKPGRVRGKTIVSILMKKEAWEKAGGFPDWRATEDLVFMEKVESLGYNTAEAPLAVASWELRRGLLSTYKKFHLYSIYNVWAGRQAYWHYGIARQYLIVAISLLLGIFHHWLWWLLIPVWLLARVVKRIILNRHEFGIKILFNPLIVFMAAIITLTIDMATFSGWLKAAVTKRNT